MVSRSSAESDYQAMANVICELVRIRDLLRELQFLSPIPMRLYCDNETTIHIAENLVFHECTKHVEVDCHLVYQKVVDDKIIETRYVCSANQLADLFTKPLGGSRVRFICDKHVQCMCFSLRGSVRK